MTKSAVNECHFLGSKYISYISVISNCIGYVTSGQLLHLMVLHNCINMGHIYKTLNRDGEAARARRQATLITIKRSLLACKLSWLFSSRRPWLCSATNGVLVV